MQETKHNLLDKKDLGDNCYLNKNCWLVKNLKYSPYKRCQYCELKFHNCLFMKFQVISLILIILSFSLFIFFENKLSILAIITVFLFVIVFGYFFNTSTEKIIKSNFSLKRARLILKDLSDNLEEKVAEQTRDIKEKNENLENQARHLERDKRELVQLDRLKDEFLQMATHELNTPIAVIQGRLSMAIDEDMCHLSDEQKKFLEPALNNTKRLSDLSKDILMVTRIDQNKMVVDLVETDLDGLIEKIVSDCSIGISERGNSIKYVRPNTTLPKTMVDQDKISEVIANLIDNANKFTENGEITIASKINKDSIVISVSDTGFGIAEDDQKRLFRKFYQVRRFDPKNPQEQQGSGLGLYISNQIIKLHGGKMWLESEIGSGSTFYFSLPLKAPKHQNLNIL